MSFYNTYLSYKDLDFNSYFETITDCKIRSILNKEKIDTMDFLALLSPKASIYIEEMAQKAHKLSVQHHGKTILLYTPLYVANYCDNKCSYCSYNIDNSISRKQLSLEELEKEAKFIRETGLKHILVLSGESKSKTSFSYIKDCISLLKNYFDSIAIEIYPLSYEEYKELIDIGVDSLTIYQETYDENIYDSVHIAGPKKNYKNRLDAPERACMANIRSINIGSLLGLNDFRVDTFFTGLHGKYIQDKYLDVEVSFSLPRIRPYLGSPIDIQEVSDTDIVQAILAYRIFMPRCGITISTRESSDFRDNLIPLGITKMSAGVCTEVGGHSQEDKGQSQFEISDKRSVLEVKNSIEKRGYQTIFKDWQFI